jgi:hypothetical protein
LAGAGFVAGFGGGAGGGLRHTHIESAYGLPVGGEDHRRRGRKRGHREGYGDKAGEGRELGGSSFGSYGEPLKTTTFEWRLRWLVVKEGWVRLYRSREVRGFRL